MTWQDECAANSEWDRKRKQGGRETLETGRRIRRGDASSNNTVYNIFHRTSGVAWAIAARGGIIICRPCDVIKIMMLVFDGKAIGNM